jgi:Ni/Fe-hydrogenase subunit HybB-like protein
MNFANSTQLFGLEHVYWQLPLVAYPFLSGLVAGSFIVGSLSHVFGLKRFEPLAKMAIIVTLAFLIGAALAPLAEAWQRERFWELITRDHFPYSPLGMFIIVWIAYVILVLVEMYFLFRQDNISLAQHGRGWRKTWHGLLTFGSRNLSELSLKRDHSILVGLAAAGILLAFAFHGYVGFVFGALKARPLWSSPMMPVIFLISAIVSGIAAMITVYTVIQGGLGENPVDSDILDGLMGLMKWAIFVDLFLDLIELLTSGVRSYASLPVYRGFSAIFFSPGPLAFNYWVVQIGLLIVTLVMTFVRPLRRSLAGSNIAALLALVSVFAMRYNTVIGAELQPKASQGLVRYTPAWFGMDSWQVVVGLFAIVVFLISLSLLLLPWERSWTASWSNEGSAVPVVPGVAAGRAAGPKKGGTS